MMQLSSNVKTKLALSVLVYFCFLSYGLGAGIIGPTLPMMGVLIGDEMATSFGLTIRSCVYCVGAMFSGWLFTRFNRQLCLSFSLALLVASVQALPFLRTSETYFVVQSLLGFSTAAIDVAANAWVLEIWPENPNPFMQGLHFSFAIGTTLSPLIAAPFLPPLEASSNATSATIDQHNIFIPFTIVSAVIMCATLTLLVLYIVKPYKEVQKYSQSKTSMEKMDSCSDSQSTNREVVAEISMCYKISILICASIILAFHVGQEMNVFNYCETFALKLGYGSATGAYFTSGFSTAFTLSRGIDILLATKFSPSTIVYFNLTLVTTGNILLYVFASNSASLLATGLVLLGLGYGGISPAVYSFIESSFPVTNKVVGLFVFASSISSIINPIIIGTLVQDNPFVFVHYSFVSGASALAFFICLHIFIVCEKRQRYKSFD